MEQLSKTGHISPASSGHNGIETFQWYTMHDFPLICIFLQMSDSNLTCFTSKVKERRKEKEYHCCGLIFLQRFTGCLISIKGVLRRQVFWGVIVKRLSQISRPGAANHLPLFVHNIIFLPPPVPRPQYCLLVYDLKKNLEDDLAWAPETYSFNWNK